MYLHRVQTYLSALISETLFSLLHFIRRLNGEFIMIMNTFDTGDDQLLIIQLYIRWIVKGNNNMMKTAAYVLLENSLLDEGYQSSASRISVLQRMSCPCYGLKCNLF